MKKVVSEFIAKFGCETGYSGSKRTLYIKKSERAEEARRAVREKWPALAFYVVVNEEIPAEAQEQSVTSPDLGRVKPEQDFAWGDQPATTEQVDSYLQYHPIDRSIKNPYDGAAKILNRTKEYVRDRYRKLREKGLVETESLTENA